MNNALHSARLAQFSDILSTQFFKRQVIGTTYFWVTAKVQQKV